MSSGPERYRFAALVEVTMDDPTGKCDRGDSVIIPGRCEDGIAYSVLHDGDYIDIEARPIGLLRAESPLPEWEIKPWAMRRANEMELGTTIPTLAEKHKAAKEAGEA